MPIVPQAGQALLPGVRSDDLLRVLASQLQQQSDEPRTQYAACAAIAALLRVYLLASADPSLQAAAGA